jgi:hypothetical protein
MMARQQTHRHERQYARTQSDYDIEQTRSSLPPSSMVKIALQMILMD